LVSLFKVDVSSIFEICTLLKKHIITLTGV
jgi:hypothetical protein